jgi:hypothetical protein
VEQPGWDDDAVAWRRFAGSLRERMGEAKRRAVDAEARAVVAEARAKAAEDRAALADHRAREAEALRDALSGSARRNRWQLTRVEKLLAEGDVPAAVDLLAQRRRWIEQRRTRG